jgi:hypothetical protein
MENIKKNGKVTIGCSKEFLERNKDNPIFIAILEALAEYNNEQEKANNEE